MVYAFSSMYLQTGIYHCSNSISSGFPQLWQPKEQPNPWYVCLYGFLHVFTICRIVRVSRRTLHREPVILKPEWASLVLQMTCGTYLLHTWLNGWIWGWRYPIGVDRHGDGVVVDCCDVVNAWSFPFFLTGVLSKKVFLGMTGHLSWCSCDHNIPWDAPPITLAKLFQSKKK